MKTQAATEAVAVDVPQVGTLGADLAVVAEHAPLVVFAHGSGSSRHSPRNRAVAARLQRDGISTLLLDLLTPAEDEAEARGGRLRFDVQMLAERLIAAVEWIERRPTPDPRSIGYFGASTGAAAALIAAAEQGDRIASVVSRGGRPDLADAALPRVTAPTLLIVGDLDVEVLALNQLALERMRCEKRLTLVEGATHLFSEPGALTQVADLAADWFSQHG
ncbi:dienelactone hydrolase family protein [Catenulispora subtropica]|uniref:Dienelactone hydrolase family protein n=1 Tax=Catenulispora subtropica TaxID=450798 RepID=A0ABP5DVY4_9ACTN